MPYHGSSSKLGNLGGVVSTPIIDDNNLISILPGLQDQAADVFSFIVSRHGSDYFGSR